MDICPNGHGLIGGNFCGECGARAVRNPAAVRCPRCQVEIHDDADTYCFYCGWKLSEPVPPGVFGRLWSRIVMSFR